MWRLQKQTEQRPANGTSPAPLQALKWGWGGGRRLFLFPPLPARAGAICRVADKERGGAWRVGPIFHSNGCPPPLLAPQTFSQPRRTQASSTLTPPSPVPTALPGRHEVSRLQLGSRQRDARPRLPTQAVGTPPPAPSQTSSPEPQKRAWGPPARCAPHSVSKAFSPCLPQLVPPSLSAAPGAGREVGKGLPLCPAQGTVSLLMASLQARRGARIDSKRVGRQEETGTS